MYHCFSWRSATCKFSKRFRFNSKCHFVNTKGGVILSTHFNSCVHYLVTIMFFVAIATTITWGSDNLFSRRKIGCHVLFVVVVGSRQCVLNRHYSQDGDVTALLQRQTTRNNAFVYSRRHTSYRLLQVNSQ